MSDSIHAREFRPDETNTPKLATKCEHALRPEKARGKCQSCYRKEFRAEKLADDLKKRRGEASLEKGADLAKQEWDKDPGLKTEFGQIMWEWLRGAKVEPIYVEENGKKIRDYATETRWREMAMRAADKAATVLGKAYVTEKVEEVKPQPLPIGESVDTSGWEGVAEELVESAGSAESED